MIKIGVMDVELTDSEIKYVMKRLQNRKAAGADGMRAEMVKFLADSEEVVTAVKRCFNSILVTGVIPESWKKTRTVMIPKTAKPTAEQLRPIAITDVTYKVFMTVMKQRLEDHVEESGMRMPEQAGFTKGGSVQDNLFILQECVHEAYRNGKQMIVVAVDFKKAYDSVRRETIVEMLKEYRVAAEVIEVFRGVYCGDATRLELGNDKNIEMEISSGIRQGCTASNVIFKLITYKVIEAIGRKIDGVQVGGVRVRSLFFADDGLLMTGSIEEARKGIREMKQIAAKFGLEMNVSKSQCMMFNTREEREEIEGVRTVEEIKYLGVTVRNKRNLYEKQREGMVAKAKKLSNLTFSVLERSCHRIMIGKAYWKGIVLPRILYGAEVVNLRRKERESMQVQENEALRKMLRAPSSVAVAGMRGEVGISNVESRIARGRLQYYRRVLQGENKLLKRVMEAAERRSGSDWFKETKKCMEWARIAGAEMKTISSAEVRRRVAIVVEEEWKEEMQRKSSLRIYRTFKKEMKEEDYSGNEEGVVWFQARTDCMRLENRRWSQDGSECKLCGAVVETCSIL